MKKYSKNKIITYVYTSSQIPELPDNPGVIKYVGRRMFRIINRSKIRVIMSAAKHPENFNKNL